MSVMQLCTTKDTLLSSLTTHANQHFIPLEVEHLLQEFEDMFQDPKQLPLFRRGHDYNIHLIQGVNLVKKRMYRYAKNQEDIIGKLIHEYFQLGVIHDSNSPYPSSVVLMGKKDGSWRFMCGLP